MISWLQIGWHFDLAIGLPLLALVLGQIIRLNLRYAREWKAAHLREDSSPARERKS